MKTAMPREKKPVAPPVWAVWKYEIDVRTGFFKVDLPADFEFLHLGLQGALNTPQMWLRVDRTGTKVPVEFYVVGTGASISGPDDSKYLGTWLEGSFVWHLFVRLPGGSKR